MFWSGCEIYLFVCLCFCRSLGGAEYAEALCSMETGSPERSGEVFFSDPRLVSNGFKVKLTPGRLSFKQGCSFNPAPALRLNSRR